MLRASILPVRNFYENSDFWGLEDELSRSWNSLKNVQAYEVSENEQAILLSYEMAGVNKNHLSVELDENILTLTGKKRSLISDNEKSETIVRKLKIPENIDTSKIEAKIIDGMLYLALPKSKREQPQKINVQDESDSEKWNYLLDDNQVGHKSTKN